jgi:hypothetical protein
MRRFLVSLALAGCATAGPGNAIVGGLDAGDGRGDAGETRGDDAGSDADLPPIDASPIDAPPQQVTLSETTSTAIVGNNSFACDDASGALRQNSFYRVFALGDFAITGALHVTEIEFGVQSAAGGPGAFEQPAQVKLGSYRGTLGGTTLDLSLVDPIAMADLTIPDGGGRVAVPITGDVRPGTNLIVELALPDATQSGATFRIGSNTDGERQPGYTSAPDCGFDQPTTVQSIADQNSFGTIDILISVTGLQ